MLVAVVSPLNMKRVARKLTLGLLKAFVRTKVEFPPPNYIL